MRRFRSGGLYREGLAEAVAGLRGNPLRAALAGLAMATAVATTVVVQTGLNGLARSARDASARAFGSDSFVLARVATGTLSRRDLAERLARNPAITRADVRFLDRVSNDQVLYAATAQRQADAVAGSRRFENATVNGTQSALFTIRDVGLTRGRAFTRDEEVRGTQVAVIGDAVAEALFPGRDPLGGTIRLAGRAFLVIGLQARQGTSGGVTLDRYVWVPLPAFERAFGAAAGLQVFARATDVARTTAAEDRARTSMRARRHLAPGVNDTFDLITPEASRSFVSTLTERVGAAGPPISMMALIAAIVVVANTTLVSVTQRTREIGVRRAVGATRTHVLVETLAESIVVAVAGGAVGLGFAAVLVVAAQDAAGVPMVLEWPTLGGSLAAAAVSGVAAGWYPARRAARLDVITALRSE